jgi:very-short-patch-repair endonuclease
LRGGRAAGMKFRRQAAIGEFIVDFYCASVGLVIELDGLSHETQRTYDEQRTIALEERGLRVVRYTNDQVLESLHEVVEDIVRLATACKGTSNPPPTPP